MCNKCGNISSHRCDSARPCGCSEPLNCGCKSKTEFTCVNYTGKHLENIDVLPGYNGDRVLEKIDERVEDLYNQISLIEIPEGTTEFEEKDTLQSVTTRGNTTTEPVRIQGYWYVTDVSKQNIFRVTDKNITENQNIKTSLIEGNNVIPVLRTDLMKSPFLDNYVSGSSILTRFTGAEDLVPAYAGRAIYNDSNVFIGTNVGTSGVFKSSENNTVIGSYVFSDVFGTEESNHHCYGNTIIGRNIQNHFDMYNKNITKHPFVRDNTMLNVIIGDSIYSNQYNRATILGTGVRSHTVNRSVLIGTFEQPVGKEDLYEVKLDYTYNRNIVISTQFSTGVYKKPDNKDYYFYIGDTTPLLEGDLSEANKKLKVYGRLQIDGLDSKNNVQGDLAYVKKVVAKPDGTLGLIDRFEDLKRTLESLTPDQKVEIRNILNS